MELEFFCKLGIEIQWFDYWLDRMFKFLIFFGVKEESLCVELYVKEVLSYYLNVIIDIEFKYLWGYDEFWGIVSCINFDFKSY